MSETKSGAGADLAGELLPTRLLSRVLLALAAIAGMMALATPFLSRRPLPLVAIYGGVIASSLVSASLARAGRSRWAVAGFITIGWLAITASAVLLGGTMSPGFFAYVVLVLLTGLVWSERAALVTGLLSLVSATAIAFAPPMWLPRPIVEVTPWRMLEAFVAEIAIVLMTLRLAIASVRRSLSHAQASTRVARDAQRQAERRVRQQAAIVRLGALALASRDTAQLFEEFVSEVARTLEAEFVKLLELSPDGDALLLRAGRGWRAGLVGTARVPAGVESQAGFTLASKLPVLVDDLETEQRFAAPELLASHSVRSGVSVAIAPDELPFGVLAAHNREPSFFHDDDALFLRTAANLLSTALSRERLEARLARQERLEALGRLAGGIAHDFNNLLTVILGYADALGDSAGRLDSRLAIKEIHSAAERAAALTRDLLAFARQEPAAAVTLDLNEVVEHSVRMLERLVGEDIRLELALAQVPCAIRANDSQIERILVNLVVNARDAQPQGGRISIETKLGTRAGREVVELQVSDRGTGMAPNVVAHVFEPFFTTKDTGKGSGLGLSTVYGLVSQLGGEIALTSELGVGTQVAIALPKASEASPAPVEPRVATSAASVAGGTILLSEDDTVLRNLMRDALVASGYVVLEARDGQEAVSWIERHLGPIRALVTDVVMPNLGGFEVGARLRAAHPEARIIYMSGYLGGSKLPDAVARGDVRFLPKPFGLIELETTLHALLGQRPS